MLPTSTNLRRLLSTGLLFLAAFVATACSGDTAGPSVVLPGSANLGLLSTATSQYASKDDPALVARLESEKARVAQAAARSATLYELLRAQYKLTSGLSLASNPLLVMCAPQPYVGAVQIVGPAGAVIGFGAHRLSIPAGALTGYTVVTAEALPSLIIQGTFSPHGLQFLKTPELTLSYAHCNRTLLPNKRIVYVNDVLTILENVTSTDALLERSVHGWIKHFSGYVVAF